jgi:hypothetical protein
MAKHQFDAGSNLKVVSGLNGLFDHDQERRARGVGSLVPTSLLLQVLTDFINVKGGSGSNGVDVVVLVVAVRRGAF